MARLPPSNNNLPKTIEKESDDEMRMQKKTDDEEMKQPWQLQQGCERLSTRAN